MRTHKLSLVLALVFVLLAALPLLAATQNAMVYGTVYDASGNPLSGVTITLDNPKLGFSRTATSGSDGSYNFAAVPPAEGFVITAIKDGKKIDIRSGIVVNVGDERVIFPPLREQAVAAAAEPVERKVESSAVQNETIASAVSGVVTGDQLRSLPLYNRNFLSLGTLTPNVHDLDSANDLAGASFSVGGSRGSNNEFLLDGADNVASSSNQAVPFQVNDAIQEFRVTSSVADAEYSGNRGGVVNIITRRASNGFHGSVFGYFANDALNSDSPVSIYNGSTFDQAAAYAGAVQPAGYFNNIPQTYNQYVASAQTAGFCTDAGAVTCNTTFDPATFRASRDRFTRSFDSKQFGANAGGALIKDKVFFFGSYEGTRIDNPNPVFERVPSTFDKTYGANGVNPWFPQTSLDYTPAKAILDLYPTANAVAIPGVLEFYRGQAPNYTHVHNILARTDIVPSSKDSFMFRFVVQDLNQLHDDTLPPSSAYPGNGAVRDALNQNLEGTYTRSITANVINELRAGYNRFNVQETAQDASFNASSIFGYADLPTFMLSGLDGQYSGGSRNNPGAYAGWYNWLVSLTPIAPTLDGKFPFARLGAPLNAPSHRIDTTAFLGDSISWTKGKHNLKFGADLRRVANSYFDAGVTRGWVYSSDIGEFSADSATEWQGIAATSYTWPSFDFAQRQASPYTGDFLSWNVAGFVQDTWRLRPHLTLNWGVRYEFIGAPSEAENQIWNYDPTANGLVRAGTSQVVNPYGDPCAAAVGYKGLTQYQQSTFTNFSGTPFDSLPWSCSNSGRGTFAQSHHTIAPRVGLAWDMFGDSKTVLRLGFGMSYEHEAMNQYEKLIYNRPVTSPNGLFGQTIDFSGGYCPLGVQCASGNRILDFGNFANSPGYAPFAQSSFPLGVNYRDQRYQSVPRIYQFNATIQRQLSRNVAMEVGYIGALGRDLPVVSDSNYMAEFGNRADAATNDIMSFFPIWTLANRSESNYHSLMARLRVAEFHGLRVNLAYSWSKSLDNLASSSFPATALSFNNSVYATVFNTYNLVPYCMYDPGFDPVFCTATAGAPLQVPSIDLTPAPVTTTGQAAPQVSRYLIPQDPLHFLTNDYGPSDFDARHRFVLDYTWELPFKSGSAWLKHWAVSGIFTGQSGQPFTIFGGPLAGEITQRAVVTGPVAIDPTNPNGAISTANLTTALPACRAAVTWPQSPFVPDDVNPCVGNSGRNAFVGDKFINMDFAVQKGFDIAGEGRILTFRAEFFNLFNRSNFFNPISQLSTDGTTINPSFGQIKSAHSPRQIQLMVRFNW